MKNNVISVRIPDRLLNEVESFAAKNCMNRTAAINYLLAQQLFISRISDINAGKSELVERDLIDD